MRAAIYARKSTEQRDVDDDAKSVTRQEEGAQKFIASKGWELADSYIDDGVSGALFADRPDFQRMMHDAERGAFEALVIFDLDRYGRDGRRTMETLHQLADYGVGVWDYSTGVKVDLDTFEGRVMTTLRAEVAQDYREKIRKHTRAALVSKAEEGLVAGGKVFGYDNVRLSKGKTVRVINDVEAKVVREIYERFAAQEGARSIAAALNAAGVPKPRAQQDRVDGWSVSTIRAVLARPLYRGEIIYGKTAKAYGRELPRERRSKRDHGQVRRPEEKWIRLDAPELRIVDPHLAERVDEIRADRKKRHKDKTSHLPRDTHGKYLLSGGMLICAECGGHFEALKSPWSTPEEGDGVYVCSTRRRKPGVCSSKLALPIRESDDVVLSVIEGEVLGTRYIEELLALVEQAPPDETSQLEADRDRLRAEIDNMVRSIAAGVPPQSLAPVIREKEKAIANIEAKLRVPAPVRPNVEQLRAALEQRAETWRQDLRKEPKMARALLRRLIGPLEMKDIGPKPDFIVELEAKTKPEGMLVGLVQDVASPTGIEPVFLP